MQDDSQSRQKRKEEGRRKKRQRIEESGGIRPRKKESPGEKKGSGEVSPSRPEKSKNDYGFKKRQKAFSPTTSHRFGRVMEKVPCRKKPRFSTLSIALPGSVLTNCQTKELRTLMVGQIARAATIYHVDEIIVFDDKLGRNMNEMQNGWRRKKEFHRNGPKEERQEKQTNEGIEEERERRPRSDPQEFMARVLQYCECPQYLRRQFFPMHPDLQFSGLLAPIDAPHHVRADDHSEYREGVVLDKKPSNSDAGSLVNCGIRNRPVQ